MAKSQITTLKGLATRMGNAMAMEDFTKSKSIGRQMNAIMPGSAAKAVRAINRGDAPSSAFKPEKVSAQSRVNAAVKRVLSLEQESGALGPGATKADAVFHSRVSSIRASMRQSKTGAPSADMSKEDAMIHSALSSQPTSAKPLNVARAASLRQSKGGGAGDQPRVPAGNPDGGQFTKG